MRRMEPAEDSAKDVPTAAFCFTPQKSCFAALRSRRMCVFHAATCVYHSSPSLMAMYGKIFCFQTKRFYIAMTALTPMLQQYRSIKQQHTDAILFFRMGDFYEMFYEDAFIASKVL